MVPDADGAMAEAVSLRVVNAGDHAVRVPEVGLELQDGSGRTLVQFKKPQGATLPGAVAAHDSEWTYFFADALEREEVGIDVSQPIAGFARLATGERLISKSK